MLPVCPVLLVWRKRRAIRTQGRSVRTCKQVACRELGVSDKVSRDGEKLTLTGGIPFHGGPVSYSSAPPLPTPSHELSAAVGFKLLDARHRSDAKTPTRGKSLLVVGLPNIRRTRCMGTGRRSRRLRNGNSERRLSQQTRHWHLLDATFQRRRVAVRGARKHGSTVPRLATCARGWLIGR